MKQSHKRWIVVLAILPILFTILFLYLYLFQTHDEAMSTDPINLMDVVSEAKRRISTHITKDLPTEEGVQRNMPTIPPNILPPTPRISIPNTIHQFSPAGVTLATPFPPNRPVGKLV